VYDVELFPMVKEFPNTWYHVAFILMQGEVEATYEFINLTPAVNTYAILLKDAFFSLALVPWTRDT